MFSFSVVSEKKIDIHIDSCRYALIFSFMHTAYFRPRLLIMQEVYV